MGALEQARFSTVKPAWLKERHMRGARRAGKVFEAHILERLAELYGDWLLPSPWITYRTGGTWCWAQPDALIIRPDLGLVGIVEVKLTHVAKAWHQMWRQYVPLLQLMFPDTLWKFKCTEICKNFNPGLSFPGPLKVCSMPFEHRSDQTGVVCWPR
jgi:hypothetical protein